MLHSAGIELVRELPRRDMANPVVIISGHADIAMAVEDCIEKPIGLSSHLTDCRHRNRGQCRLVKIAMSAGRFEG
jgi:FixJ family two-component response regulator